MGELEQRFFAGRSHFTAFDTRKVSGCHPTPSGDLAKRKGLVTAHPLLTQFSDVFTKGFVVCISVDVLHVAYIGDN